MFLCQKEQQQLAGWHKCVDLIRRYIFDAWAVSTMFARSCLANYLQQVQVVIQFMAHPSLVHLERTEKF